MHDPRNRSFFSFCYDLVSPVEKFVYGDGHGLLNDVGEILFQSWGKLAKICK